MEINGFCLILLILILNILKKNLIMDIAIEYFVALD